MTCSRGEGDNRNNWDDYKNGDIFGRRNQLVVAATGLVQEFKSFPAQILLAVLMTVMMTVTLTTMMLATMRMVPKERCRCSRVNKLSCSDIHESSGEHLSRPFSLEMTMMVMVMN